MLQLKNEKIAIPVVLFAGLLWSFGPLVVRYMNDPNLVPWQYLFTRGITIFCLLNIFPKDQVSGDVLYPLIEINASF